MKYILNLFFLLVLAAGCKEKRLTQTELENKLMKTMNDYLNKTGGGKVKFTVQDVIFYPEKNHYTCEFRVNMHSVTIDTIGTMAATISKDFTTVARSR